MLAPTSAASVETPSPHWRQGLVAVTLAVACFAGLDSSTKLLSGVLPLVIVVWTRYAFLFAVTSATQWLPRGRAAWRTRHPGLQVVRGACLLACSGFAFLSLRHMPVGEFTAVVMLTPLVITALAATGLGERVSVWRWGCVLGGFAGALVVIRPQGSDLNWTLLYPLGTVATNALYQVLTSRLARDDDTGTIQLYTGAVGTAIATLGLPFVWQAMPPLWVCGVLLLIGVLSLVGHQFLIRAYGQVPASRLTPFLYLQIGFAMGMGWLVFGTVPDRWSWLGVGLIAACGVAGTWLAGRERVRTISEAPASAPASASASVSRSFARLA